MVTEYYDDGVKFGTGHEMVREILHLRSQVATLKQALEDTGDFLRAKLAAACSAIDAFDGETAKLAVMSQAKLELARQVQVVDKALARAALAEEDKENVSGRPEASPATQGPEN